MHVRNPLINIAFKSSLKTGLEMGDLKKLKKGWHMGTFPKNTSGDKWRFKKMQNRVANGDIPQNTSGDKWEI